MTCEGFQFYSRNNLSIEFLLGLLFLIPFQRQSVPESQLAYLSFNFSLSVDNLHTMLCRDVNQYLQVNNTRTEDRTIAVRYMLHKRHRQLEFISTVFLAPSLPYDPFKASNLAARLSLSASCATGAGILLFPACGIPT